MTKINSIHYDGKKCVPVCISCETTDGIGVYVLGIGQAQVKESLLRVCTALQSIGCSIPGKKITISVTPTIDGDIGIDLPIAIAILAETGQMTTPKDIGKWYMCGELGLDASLREVNHPVNRAMNTGGLPLILPMASAECLKGLGFNENDIHGASNLYQAIEIINGNDTRRLSDIDAEGPITERPAQTPYFLDDTTLHAVMIAAVGGHDMTVIGPTEAHKGMVSGLLADIRPKMTRDEAVEMLSNCHSTGPTWIYRPVRTPHYTSPLNAFINDCELARHGVLCLNEYNRLATSVLTAISTIRKEKKITICRLRDKTEIPTTFQTVLVTKSCPCGHYGDRKNRCVCSKTTLNKWTESLSSPASDHTMQVWVNADTEGKEINVNAVREQVNNAVEMQKRREQKTSNNELKFSELHITEEQNTFVENLVTKMNLRASSGMDIFRIARSIADLSGCEEMTEQHLAEAAAYQFLNKKTI